MKKELSKADHFVMDEAAKRYAAADPSDSFALRRARTQLKNGIASYSNKDGEPGYFDAEPTTETRMLPGGTEYQAVIYKNRCRP